MIFTGLSILLFGQHSAPHNDKLFLLGDFNARVGADYHVWGEIIGRHGIDSANSNGLRLLNTCSEFYLVITAIQLNY